MKALALAAVAMLAACSHGGSVPSFAPATIPDVSVYLRQSATPDANPATPLGQGTPWAYERFDFGHYQAEQSFARDDGTFATIWSYPPFGPFVVGNGDGGEVYAVNGSAVYITETQDGGRPGVVQQFGAGWWAFDNAVPDCPQWRGSPDGLGRACRTSVIYTATGVAGNQITADTIVSEHYDLPGLGGKMERAYYGANWGRLAWQAWVPQCLAPVDLSGRALPISFDGPPAEHPDWIRCDERLVTNIVQPPPTPGLSGAGFGWLP